VPAPAHLKCSVSLIKSGFSPPCPRRFGCRRTPLFLRKLSGPSLATLLSSPSSHVGHESLNVGFAQLDRLFLLALPSGFLHQLVSELVNIGGSLRSAYALLHASSVAWFPAAIKRPRVQSSPLPSVDEDALERLRASPREPFIWFILVSSASGAERTRRTRDNRSCAHPAIRLKAASPPAQPTSRLSARLWIWAPDDAAWTWGPRRYGWPD
jgi:hypothetical protein